MDRAIIATLEKLCFVLYNAPSTADQQKAEYALQKAFPTFAENGVSTLTVSPPISPDEAESLGFTADKPIDGIRQSTALLQQSASPFVQMYLTTHLKALISNHFSMLSGEDKLGLKNFLLSYLHKNVSAPPFVVTAMSQILSLIIRMGWFDGESLRHLQDDLNPMLQSSSIAEQTLGVQILSIVVFEISTPSYSVAKVTKNRNAVIGFRDTQLLKAFQLGVSIMQRWPQQTRIWSRYDLKLKKAVFRLLRNCLCFDFAGIMPDESDDVFDALRVTSTWRHTFDENLLFNLFSCYSILSPSVTTQVMECIAYVVSVRPSHFGVNERATYINTILSFTARIMENSTGMDNVNNYHEFCKVLSRFKLIYPFAELIKSSHFPQWISLVTEFTIKGFGAWHWSPNSVVYLLTLWSKMETSTSNSSSSSDNNSTSAWLKGEFSQLALQVATAYVDSMISSIDHVLGSADDPLEEEEPLILAMELLASIARRNYQKSSEYVASLTSKLINQAEIISSGGNNNTSEMAIYKAKLTWCTYIIASFIGSRASYRSPESQDIIDDELSYLVLRLLALTQGPLQSTKQLDSAFLYFFQQFIKSYIKVDDQQASKIYNKLGEYLGIHDQQSMSDVILQHIAYSLKCHAGNEAIVSKTLVLFDELSAGDRNPRLVSKLNSAKPFFAAHGTYEFAFLQRNVRARTQYYTTICRLLFVENISRAQFTAFMQPFADRLTEIQKLTMPTQYYNEEVQITITGLCRDLRGFVFAIMSRRNMALMWDWIYPEYLDTLQRALEVYGVHLNVSVQILKFFNEFCLNRTRRLTLNICSPNGILLFREISKVLCSFAAAISKSPAETQQVRESRYNGITTCFSMFRNALAGNYVPLGAFCLYGDPVLQHAYQAMFSMIKSVPETDLVNYPKMTTQLLNLITVVASKHHILLLNNIDLDVFLLLCKLLGEMVKSSNQELSLAAASSIDNLASFVCMRTNEPPQQVTHAIVQAFVQYPDIFTYWLSSILGIILFEDSPMQWGLSRPLLPLVMLNSNFYEVYINSLSEAQLPERRTQVFKLLCDIMNGVELSLNVRMADKLTNALSSFRRDVTQSGISLMPLPDVNWRF